MNIDPIIQILEPIEIFKHCERNALRMIALGAEIHQFNRGETIYKQNENAKGGSVLVKGRVELNRKSMENQTERVIVKSPITLLNETALLRTIQNIDNAIAREIVKILFIPKTLFMRVIAQYPESAKGIKENLGQSINEFVGELDNVAKGLNQANEIYISRKIQEQMDE